MLNLFKKYFHSLQESNECDYKAYVGMKKDAKNVVTDLSVDDVFKNFFISQLTIDACLSSDHKTNFCFSLGCLWNVQIQF